jgi:hypothetical protein
MYRAGAPVVPDRKVLNRRQPTNRGLDRFQAETLIGYDS